MKHVPFSPVLRRIWWIPLCIPLLGLIVLDYQTHRNPPPGFLPTGILAYDETAYLAHSRKMLDEGRWLRYSNAFSWAQPVKPIYIHLYMLLFSFLQRLTGLEWIALERTVRLMFCAAAMGALGWILRTVAIRAGTRFLLAWGAAACGGLAWATAVILRWVYPHRFPPLIETELGRFGAAFYYSEMSYFYESPHLARLGDLPTESFYHCIAFLTGVAYLKRHYKLTLLGIGFLWWAHPFTALLWSAIYVTAGILNAVVNAEKRTSVLFSLSVIGIMAPWVAYHFWLAHLSPEHASVARQFRDFQFTLAPYRAFPMLGLVALAPFLALLSRQGRTLFVKDRIFRFLVIWFFATGLFVLHDRFVSRPLQPLHFDRGYWFLAGVLLIGYFAEYLYERIENPNRKRLFVGGLVIALLLQTPDIFFYHRYRPKAVRALAPPEPVYLGTDQSLFLTKLSELSQPLRIVPIFGHTSLSNSFNILIPSMTPHRTAIGVFSPTPWYYEKQDILLQATRVPCAEIVRVFDPMDALVTERDSWDNGVAGHCPEFEEKVSTGGYVLAVRKGTELDSR